jgi:hypothetical protein
VSIKLLLLLLYNVTVLDHFWPLVVPCTWDAVRIVNSFITISHVRNYNHNYFTTLLRVYTITILTHQYSILFSHSLHNTLDIFTYSHFPCLSPIENSLVELLFKNSIRLHWLTSQLSITISDYHSLPHMQSLQFTLWADCDIFVKLSPRTVLFRTYS